MNSFSSFSKMLLGVLFVLFLSASVAFADEAGEYVDGEVMVVLKNRLGELSSANIARAATDGYIDEVARSVGSQTIRTYAALSASGGNVIARMQSFGKTTEEMIAELAENPDVLAVSPNYIMQERKSPDDPYYTDGTLWGLSKINAETAWDTTTGANNVYIVVMDSGIDMTHPDLKANFAEEYSRNFIDSSLGRDVTDGLGHGTHVAGIAAAVGNNKVGTTGVCWNAKIISLKVLDDRGYTTSSSLANAFDYLLELMEENPDMKIPVVNLSLGGWYSFAPQNSAQDATWYLYKALDIMNETVIVVASGNDGAEVGAPAPANVGSYIKKGYYSYPESYQGLDNMISASSITSTNGASTTTNWSSKYLHLAAPGVDITSTWKNNTYGSKTGNSMAAPYIAGSVALLASANSDMTASELKSHLLKTANSRVNPDASPSYAPQIASDTKISKYGLLNIGSAMTTTPTSVSVSDISLVRSTSSTSPGASAMMIATVSPEEATDKALSWSSSNTAVATVNQAGVVTMIAEGATTITARATDGSGVRGSYALTVGTKSGSSGGGGCDAGSAALFALFAAGVATLRLKRR